MSHDPALPLDAVASLRAEFARSFSAAPTAPVETVDLVLVRVGGAPFAFRITELRGIHPRRSVVPLPAGGEGFLGLMAIRGQALPVYDLAPIVGVPAVEAAWLAIVAAPTPVGIGFTLVEGVARVPLTAITRDETRALVPAFVHWEASTRPIVDLHAVVTWIASRAEGARGVKERS